MARSTKSSTKPASRATKAKSTTKAPTKTTEVQAVVDTPVSAAPVTKSAPDVVNTLGKKDLIERVVQASGIKKKDAKPVIEAMLRELGDALSRGETLNLQPFGKGIVKSRKSLENAEVVELRLRRSKQAMAGSIGSVSGSTDDSESAPPLTEAAE